jgi:hypothetical protein
MAGTRAKALAKMQAAYGYWRPLLSCSSLPTKVRLLMVQTFIYPRSCMARKCDTTKVKDKMSAVVKALRSILALHPETASDVLYGDTGLLPPGVLIDAKLAAQMPEHGGWPMAQGGAAILIRG